MEKFQLGFFESTILAKIKLKKESVLMIPVDIYAALIYYCEGIEDYETCVILRDLEDKVTIKTLSEFFEEFEREAQTEENI